MFKCSRCGEDFSKWDYSSKDNPYGQGYEVVIHEAGKMYCCFCGEDITQAVKEAFGMDNKGGTR